jgi:hypothetical protein
VWIIYRHSHQHFSAALVSYIKKSNGFTQEPGSIPPTYPSSAQSSILKLEAAGSSETLKTTRLYCGGGIFSCCSSLTPYKCRDSTRFGHDHFLTNPFQFIIQQSTHRLMIYVYSMIWRQRYAIKTISSGKNYEQCPTVLPVVRVYSPRQHVYRAVA